MLRTLLSIFVIILSSSTFVYTQDQAVEENVARPLDELVDVSDTAYVPPFTIFVHEDCPHCQDVEDFVAENKLGGEITYMQLKDNDENLAALTSLWEEYEVPGDGPAWPIMFYNDGTQDTYSLGSDPIIEVLADEYDIEVETEPVETENSSSSALLIVGGLLLAVIFGYGVVSMVSNKKS